MKPRERAVEEVTNEILKRVSDNSVSDKLKQDLEKMTITSLWDLHRLIMEMPERKKGKRVA